MRIDKFCRCVLEAGARMPEYEGELCRLDMGIGDGDHGVTVRRGFLAVDGLFHGDPGQGGQMFFQSMGDALASSMGGAIGPIYGLFFSGLGSVLNDEVDAAALSGAMRAAVEKVMRVAKVAPGEKTIVDGMIPAVEALEAAGCLTLSEALRQAAEAADAGAERTIPMMATKGRARFLRERSIGFRDAGASSFAIYMDALADAVTRAEKEGQGHDHEEDPE